MGADPSPAKGVFVSGQITSLAQTFQNCNVPLKTRLVVLGVGWCLPLLGSPGTACVRDREGASAGWLGGMLHSSPVPESAHSDVNGARQES